MAFCGDGNRIAKREFFCGFLRKMFKRSELETIYIALGLIDSAQCELSVRNPELWLFTSRQQIEEAFPLLTKNYFEVGKTWELIQIARFRIK